jgi:hypothetical protein
MSKKQSIYNEPALVKIFGYLNVLCMNSEENSRIFVPLVDLLFKNVLYHYDFIVKLVQGNHFFTNMFYKK